MNAIPRPLRLVAEALIVVLLGVAIMAALYSEWWRLCCSAMNGVIGLLFSPAFVFAMVIGGGPHGATRFDVYIGTATECVVLWALVRLVVVPRWKSTKLARSKS